MFWFWGVGGLSCLPSILRSVTSIGKNVCGQVAAWLLPLFDEGAESQGPQQYRKIVSLIRCPILLSTIKHLKEKHHKILKKRSFNL